MRRNLQAPKRSGELLTASAMEIQTGKRPVFNLSDAKNANPRRSAAWRYERVTRLLGSESNHPHRTLDDRWTKELWRFMSLYQTLQNDITDPDVQEFHLQRRYPTLSTAFFLFNGREQDPFRYTLEARILARQSDEDIGHKCRVAPEVIALYEYLFYNVRDRLDHSDFIAASVIGPVFRVGLDAINPELVAKYFGYFCGPIVLDYVIQGFSEGFRPTSDAEVVDYLEAQAIKAIKMQAMILTSTMNPSRFDVRSVMEGFLQLINIERNGENGQEGRQVNQLTELIDCLRAQKPIPRGDDAKKLAAKVHGHYAAGYVELRADEKQIAARLGADAVPGIADLRQIKPPTIEGDLRIENPTKPGQSS